MGILKRIFILVLFLFSFGEIIRISLGNGIVVKPIDIGVCFLVFMWFVSKLLKRQKFRQQYVFVPMMLFVLTGFFSLIISDLHLSINEFIISFLYLFRWVVYAGIFFVVYDFDKKFKINISKLLLVTGSLVVGLGYLQYFFYSSLRNLYYLGWDEHMYRMFSVFLDPNFAGAFFVLFFLFLASIFIKKRSVLIGLLLILTLGTIFLTFSRSALIMLAISSSLLFILMNKKLWIAILLGLILLVLSVSSRYFNIENINLFRIVSSEARLETAKKAIGIIKDHPVFGVGFNAYRYVKLGYGLKRDNVGTISHADSGVDSSILFILVTTGVVGFLFYFIMWIRILKTTSVLAVASIIGVFIDSLFVNSLFYPFIMMWIWILLGLNEE